jgi:hypothetical protein
MYMAQKWTINSMLAKITPSPYNLLAHHHLPPSPPLLQRTQGKSNSPLQCSIVFSKALYNTQQHYHDLCKILWHQTSNLASNCGYTKQVALMQKIQSHQRQLY